MAADIKNFNLYNSLHLSGKYDSLNENFNILNNQFATALHKKRTLCGKEITSREVALDAELKVLHASLTSLARHMQELSHQMNLENFIKAPCYMMIQREVKSACEQRAHDLQTYVISHFKRVPGDVRNSVFSCLSFQELATTSAVSSKWQLPSKAVFQKKSKQETKVVLDKGWFSCYEEIIVKLIARNEISEAVAMFEKLPLPNQEDYCLQETINSLLSIKNKAIHQQAIEFTKKLTPRLRDQGLFLISKNLTLAGNVNLAPTAARAILSPIKRDEALFTIVASAPFTNKQVTELAFEISDNKKLSHTLMSLIIPDLIQMQEFDIAIEMACRIPVDEDQNMSLGEIFHNLVMEGMFDKALNMLGQFSLQLSRSRSDLHRLARALAEQGRFKQAFETAEKQEGEFYQSFTKECIERVRNTLSPEEGKQ